MSPRRILFITIDVPQDGGSGGQIVSWRLIESYASIANVDVVAITSVGVTASDDLLSLADSVTLVPAKGFHFASARLRLAAKFARSQFGSTPYRLTKFDLAGARLAVASLIERHEYDLVHLEHLSSLPYRELAQDVPAVLMEQNVESELVRRMSYHSRWLPVRLALRREARRVEAVEAQLTRAVDHVFALSDPDMNALTSMPGCDAEKVSVWPVPVTPLPIDPRLGDQPFRVLILGSLRSAGRRHGLNWFLRDVWPRVREDVAGAQLSIVGGGASKDLQARSGKDGITVHGYVDDLHPILSSVTVCAIPLFIGAGVRIKILELVSHCIPCIGTSVAIQGLDDIGGIERVDSVDEWVEALVRTARSPELLRRAVRSGSAELAERRSHEAAVESLAKVLQAANSPKNVRDGAS